MKKMIMAILFSLVTFSTFASEVIQANKEDSLKVLDLSIEVMDDLPLHRGWLP